MKEKKNLGIKLIKSLYGINGPFDDTENKKSIILEIYYLQPLASITFYPLSSPGSR